MGHGRWRTDDVGFCVTLGRMLALSESQVFSHPMKDRRAKVGVRCGQIDRCHSHWRRLCDFVVTFKGGCELKRNVPNIV